MQDAASMLIDCGTCPVREVRCADCAVTALRGLPSIRVVDGELFLDPAERRAVEILVTAGLVGRDRAVTLTARREPWSHGQAVG